MFLFEWGKREVMGLGTIINVAGIVAGGVLGHFFGRFLTQRFQDTLNRACGVSVLFIGLGGALEGMLRVGEDGLTSGRSMLIVMCMTLGALLGELLNLEDRFERFGAWLKRKTGNAGEQRFVEGFVTASLTVSIGAMAVVGSIEDGLFGDVSILATKAVLDLIIVLVMTCSLGKGCAFSAIPVACFQGAMTLLSRLIRPVMTQAALGNLSLVGSILIFCVGFNLVWGKRVRVANLLPAILFAVAFAFAPFEI